MATRQSEAQTSNALNGFFRRLNVTQFTVKDIAMSENRRLKESALHTAHRVRNNSSYKVNCRNINEERCDQLHIL